MVGERDAVQVLRELVGVGVGAKMPFLDSLAERCREDAQPLVLELLQPMVGGLQPGELFVEKTPSHILFVPEIHALLPEARFIHVLARRRVFALIIR